MVIQIVDSPDKIAEFLPYVEEAVRGGLITVDPVQVIAYRHAADQA